MPINYSESVAQFSHIVSVEEAEGLLEWLQAHPRGGVDLSDCQHLHAANLQVLMAAQPDIRAWPTQADLNAWLRQAFSSN